MAPVVNFHMETDPNTPVQYWRRETTTGTQIVASGLPEGEVMTWAVGDPDIPDATDQLPVAIAPTAAGGIADQYFRVDTAVTPLDVSADFSGTEPITYALAPSSAALPAGLSLDSGTGVISGTPTTEAGQISIVVRGTNASGSDDTAFGVTVASAAIDADAAAYISAVETADGQTLEAGVKTAYDTFIFGCKTDGNWDAIKSSAILAGARTLSGALVALKGTAPTNVSSNFVSADYARKTGLKGDGSTKYLDSNRANDADPQNNSHNAVYVSEAAFDGVTQALMGTGSVDNASNCIGVYKPMTGPDRLFFRNRNSTLFDAPATTGFLGASRNVSTSFDYRANGNNVTASAASETPVVGSNYIFGRNNSGLNKPSDARIAFYSIGEAVDLAALDARVTQLITDLDGAIA